MNSLPRDEDGQIMTSAVYGQSYLVEVFYTTEADGAATPQDVRGTPDQPRTLHGPFVSWEEAQSWVEAYPEDPDVDDMQIIHMNLVRDSLLVTRSW